MDSGNNGLDRSRPDCRLYHLYEDINQFTRIHFHYFSISLTSTARVSLMTVTLICPGYSIPSFDFLYDIPGKADRRDVINFFRFNQDTDFTSGLNSVRFFDTPLKLFAMSSRFLQTLKIIFQGFPSGSRPGTADGIRRRSKIPHMPVLPVSI